MKIILDANILFAALIRDSTTRELILLFQADFYFPEPLLEEMEKHKELIKKKAGFNESEFNHNLQRLFECIALVPFQELKENLDIAKKTMEKIDPDDAVVLAAALAHPRSIIWSTDRDLTEQKLVKAVTTKELWIEYKKFIEGALE